jgi:hypothetical protein
MKYNNLANNLANRLQTNEAGERLYRLEFNETQQSFHLDNYTHDPDTHGWFTIADHCTDIEFWIFEAFVNRTQKQKLTREYLTRSLTELKGFLKNLSEYNLAIKSLKTTE